MIPLLTPCLALRSILFALVMLCFAGISLPARGQSTPAGDNCSGGTLYYLAFPDTTTNTYDDRFPPPLVQTHTTAFSFYVYSPVAQNITVSRSRGAGMKYAIEAGEIREIEAEPIGIPLITILNTPQAKALTIEAEFPVVVIGYMMTPYGAEAFTPVPVEWWGTEYYAAGWPGEVVRDIAQGSPQYAARPKQAPQEILIIAAYDDTKVRISPRAVLSDCNGCQTVTLNAGEVYLVQSTVDTTAHAENQPDLAGSLIRASKRIGVITGNTRLSHRAEQDNGLAKNSFKNLAIEWIRPVEAHGTQFAFTPVWDTRHMRDGLDLNESRREERIRIFGTHEGETEVRWTNDLGVEVPGTKTPLLPQEVSDEKLGVPVSRYFKTTQPAMAMASPGSVVKETTVDGSESSYQAWSSFMVELIPREQWTSFAPVAVPSVPSAMVHYINLVVDTAHQSDVYYRQGNGPRQLFDFNRGKIPGSDLIWGTMTLEKGVNYFIEGENDVHFTGQVYGMYQGGELFRAIGEYEEDISLAYGYPLAPSHCLPLPPDEYQIRSHQDCEVMEVTVTAKNNPAAGLRSITLLPDSSENVRLEFITPANVLDIKSRTIGEAKFRLVAIDPTKIAHGVVIIEDRTGRSKRWRVTYYWEEERVDFNPSSELNFGQVRVNTEAGEKLVTITNPLDRKDIVIKGLGFVFGTEGFVIVRVDPAFDWSSGKDSIVLKPGESLRVWISNTPTVERKYLDSLRLQLGCISQTIPIRLATPGPCLYVDDLNFGTVNIGESRTLPLTICNNGKGSITFQDPWLTWLTTEFSVKQTEIDKLKGVTLKENECVTITVKFTAPADSTGQFRTTGRFWADTRDCRDTSIWKANVIKPGPQITGYDWGKRWVSENPCTKNPEKDYRATVQIRNTGESPYEVVALQIASGTDPDKVFAIAASTVTPGLILQPGASYDAEVIFDPKEEKVYYPSPAEIRMIYKTNVAGVDVLDSTFAPLEGVGIESYVEIDDQSFGKIEFKQPAGTSTASSSVTIRAKGTRPVTITNATITPGTDFKLVNPWTPVTLDPENPSNNSIVVPIDFVPQNIDPALKTATINIQGDFAYDVCSISDSAGSLDGTLYTLGVEAKGYDFGTLLTCFERDGVVTLRNIGTEPVIISAISPTGDPSFTVDPDHIMILPISLAPAGDPNGRDVVLIPVHYAPRGRGTHNGSVTVSVITEDGLSKIPDVVVPLVGVATHTSSHMSIARDYKVAAGSSVPVAVTLDDDPEEAQIQEFIIDLDYGVDLVFLDSVALGSLLPENDGWAIDILGNPGGNLTARVYNKTGRSLSGTGEVLVLNFTALGVGSKGFQTEIPFIITPVAAGENQQPCVELPASAGLLTVIDNTNGESGSVKILEVTPNPIKTRANIRISVAKKEKVQLGVYWPDGRRVALLLDKELDAKVYDISWDITGLIDGAYYVQVKGGEEHDSRSVIILR